MLLLFLLLPHLILTQNADVSLPVDPEALMTVPEIIRRFGYPAEEHQVITSDGYILTLHRIPHGRNESLETRNNTRPVVFLQHGLLCSSSMWVLNLPHQSAGFVLADQGYDVWMGNSRGNVYSQKHTRMRPEEDAFWKFSWQEMAEHDLSSSINGILLYTKQPNLYYIGHSQGTLTLFTKLSIDPEFGKKIRMFFALAPVARLSHPKGTFQYLGKLYDQAKALLTLFGDGQFLRNNLLTRVLADLLCDLTNSTNSFCTNLIFSISGPDSHQFNATRVPIYLAHNPAGTSIRNLVHYAQLVHFKRFAPYDLGQERNLKVYGAPFAPEYDLSQVSAPTYLFYSEADYLANPEDVEGFIMRRLNSSVLKIATKVSDFNHNDFMWGLRARKEIYDPIINIIRQDVRRQEIQKTLEERHMGTAKIITFDQRRGFIQRKNDVHKSLKRKIIKTTSTIEITSSTTPFPSFSSEIEQTSPVELTTVSTERIREELLEKVKPKKRIIVRRL